MSYDTLMGGVQRRLADMLFDMARCNDVYRLNQLLRILSEDISTYHCLAKEMVDEIEKQPGEELYYSVKKLDLVRGKGLGRILRL